jgi:hypothetical protein
LKYMVGGRLCAIDSMFDMSALLTLRGPCVKRWLLTVGMQLGILHTCKHLPCP